MKNIYYYFFTRLLFLPFLLAGLAMTTKTNITTDQSALLALKAVISEPNQILANNWSVASPVCDWIGVTCGSLHHRVTALSISNMNITGTIPLQLGNLSFLVSLDISANKFHGELPPELARLHRLRALNLSINNLSGQLPSWFGLLGKLQYLSLSNNSFTGTIPSSIYNISNLESLQLSFNYLDGTIGKEIGNLHELKTLTGTYSRLSGSLPLEIFNISSLEVISLQGNSLSGSLLDNLCQHLGRLQYLDISVNQLSGQMPSTWSSCSGLQVLALNYNNFTGRLSKDIGNLKALEVLFLGHNNLEGGVPNEIGNMTMLHILQLSGANLTGTIPEEVCNLPNLEVLHLGYNRLWGSIPVKIFNMSNLRIIGLSENNHSGKLPSSIGHGLPNLGLFAVDANELEGAIPASFSNASKLVMLSLRKNKFSGPIPNSLGDLRLLRVLDLGENYLTSEPSSLELNFITSLTNCRFLRIITLYGNPLSASLPESIGNFSASLESIYAQGCEIKGKIPDSFGNLSHLLFFNLAINHLTGSVPGTFRGMQKLQALYLDYNQLSGPILKNLCDLKSLYLIQLPHNQISGSIPSCLGNITSLRNLYFQQNLLNSSIPATFWNLTDLLELDLSDNSLSGLLPQEIQNLKVAIRITLTGNHISGDIPRTIGGLEKLAALSLARNRLQGPIPDSLSDMLSLQFLDLSYNNLSGLIPKALEGLSSLNYINLSFNELSGEIPSGGPFKNFTSQSFLSNDALCGAPRFLVPPCSPPPIHKSSRKKMLLVMHILLGIAVVTIVVVLAIIFIRYRRKINVPRAIDMLPIRVPERISYYELQQATNGYSESNLLGTGSFGSVYKGTLTDGMVVAVKVFNLQLETSHKSFVSECEVLRNLRHRNLTKVIGLCSNDDFKALVLEYMPNGSLEKWLYSHNHYLDLIQRISIMADVSCALEYLHYGYTIPVVHCDLKPANILLDGDMIAHVGDFGLAKLLNEEESGLHTKTLATLGYIAPEYGSEGQVSTRSDVYSFGVVLMETFSRKKPSDEMFSGDLSLKNWIEDSLPSATIQVIDANLLKPEDKFLSKKLEFILMILELALTCCKECPRDRISMKDVAISLLKIKHQLVSVCRD